MSTRVKMPPISIDDELGVASRHEADDAQLLNFIAPALAKWRQIAIVGIATGAIGYGASYLITPIYTARTSIISPQQQQNSASAALASLGALAGLSGAGSALKSPADQYISIMQSVTVSNKIIDQFKLMNLYESKFRIDAQQRLHENVRISAGKKDNLITVEVDDKSPALAAEIANAYVAELRQVTNNLALTEAQQRRLFFEQQLLKAKDALRVAQVNLQKTGFTAGALKSEPKSAAEAYARAKAAVAATEVRLGALRRTMTDSAPEVQQLVASLAALRAQLAQLEEPLQANSSQDYVSSYREFKYQEALFDIYAKQFELAKMDEAREGTLVQVLDPATAPERRSKPKRLMIAAGSALIAALLVSIFYGARYRNRSKQITTPA